MLGVSHSVSGLAVGSAAVTLTGAPPPVQILLVGLVGGSALLPDIDHHNSTVARALGPITNLIARLVDWLSVIIYHATRTPRDPAARENGHRLITHTYTGALTFAVIAAVTVLSGPIPTAVLCALVIGLCGHGTRGTGVSKRVMREVRKLVGLRLPAALFLAVVSGLGAWWVSERYPGWWWCYPVAVLVGCIIHREGDWCTNSGVPRRLAPLVARDGRRWDKSKCPHTFETGTADEIYGVLPVLGLALIAGLVTGLHGWPLVLHAALTLAAAS